LDGAVARDCLAIFCGWRLRTIALENVGSGVPYVVMSELSSPGIDFSRLGYKRHAGA